MRTIFVIVAVFTVIDVRAVTRGRTRFGGRQLPFPGQPEVTEQPWDHVDVQKVDSRRDPWASETAAIEDLEDTVVVGEADGPLAESSNSPRQFYPGWEETASEVPKPISVATYPPDENASEPPSYQQPYPPQPPPQQPGYGPGQRPTQRPTQRPSRPSRPSNRPTVQPSTPKPEPISPPGCLAPRGQFPSPNDCANYLNCWDEVVIEQKCPNDLLFNEVSGICDFDYNVDCGSRPGPTPKPPLAPGSKRCPDLNGRYRSATNCSEFFVCVAGSPIKFSCPRGLVYNDVVSVCDYPYNVDCQGAATPKPEPLPRPEAPKPTTQQPQQPSQPSQPTQRPQPTFPPSAYPENPWLARNSDTDPWHQRPVATQHELDMKHETLDNINSGQSVESEPTENPTIQSPWDMMHSIPAELTKVPCENGNVHRLDDACSSVVVCRNKRPQLVQCPIGLTYDRPSDSCLHFNIAKC